MTFFWLRFFGSRVRDNYGTSALTAATQSASKKTKPFEDFLNIDGVQQVSAEEDFVNRTRGGRRSALELTRDSLDVGPQNVVRLSFDTFANPSFQLTSVLKSYTNIQPFHRGSHARLMKANRKLVDDTVIFKLYDKTMMNPDQIDNVSTEIEILKNATYGSVELLDVFEDNRLILLALKECVNGSLMACMDDHGGFLIEELCIKYLVMPLLKILSDLHKDGFVHRDIKPEHILYDAGYNAYLCDFLSVGVGGRDTFTAREGTLAYMAPEMLAKPTPEEIFLIILNHGVDESEMETYNQKVDVWSLGVVIVEALTGMRPFVSDTPEGMAAVHAKHFSGEQYSAPLRQLETSGQISDEGLDFLSKIFRWDPNDRADAQSLLCHPWLYQNHCDF